MKTKFQEFTTRIQISRISINSDEIFLFTKRGGVAGRDGLWDINFRILDRDFFSFHAGLHKRGSRTFKITNIMFTFLTIDRNSTAWTYSTLMSKGKKLFWFDGDSLNEIYFMFDNELRTFYLNGGKAILTNNPWNELLTEDLTHPIIVSIKFDFIVRRPID